MTDKIPSKRRWRSKVDRIMMKYDLDVDALSETLVRRWTAEGDERSSVRDLIEWVNMQYLEGALTAAGERPRPAELETLYHQLTDDDVSAGERTRVRRDLERRGVDVEALEDDFVSRYTLHRYLTDILEAEYEGVSDAERFQNAREMLGKLRQRVSNVTEDRLTSLREAGQLTLGPFNVGVTIHVTCRACGERYDVLTLLDRGGCECEESATEQTDE